MKNSPLQLERYFLTALHLDANLDAKVGQKATLTLGSKVAVARHQTDPLRWKIDLTVHVSDTKEAESPYRISVSFSGFFAVDESFPKEKVNALVETNGPSVLFAAAREMIANVTARGPWPTVFLPTQSFAKPKQSSDPVPAATPQVKE